MPTEKDNYATPLDEMLDNLIRDLHENRYEPWMPMENESGAPNPRATMHALALVLRDTRERHRGLNTAVRLLTARIDTLESGAAELHREVSQQSLRIDHMAGSSNAKFVVALSQTVSGLMEKVDDIAKRTPLFTGITAGSGGGGGTARTDGWRNLTTDPTTRSLQEHADELAAAREDASDARRAGEQLTSMLMNERKAYDKALAEARDERAELAERLALYETTLAEALGVDPGSTSMAALIAQAKQAHSMTEGAHAEVNRLKGELDTANKALDQTNGEYNTIQRNFRSLQKLQATTQEQLDKFTGACADQTIQIMELRGAAMRAEEQHKVELSRVGQRNLRRIATVLGIQDEAKLSWDMAVDVISGHLKTAEEFKRAAANATGYPDCYAEDCVIEQIATIAQRNLELRSQFGDSDRVPLRMDLDAARGKLDRMDPLLKALHPWRTKIATEVRQDHISPEAERVLATFDEWQDAEAKAQNPSADDDIAF